MKARYIGRDYVAIQTGKIYDVLSIEKGWYRIMTDLEETYLFPPTDFEIVEGSPEDLEKAGKVKG